MSLPVRCRACGWQAKAPDSAAGKRIRCAECGESLRVGGRRRALQGRGRGAEKLKPLEVLRPVRDMSPPPPPRPIRRARPQRQDGGNSGILIAGLVGGCGTLLLVVGVIARVAWVAAGSLDLSSPSERLEEFTALPAASEKLQPAVHEQNGHSIQVPLEFDLVQEVAQPEPDGTMVYMRHWWGPQLPDGDNCWLIFGSITESKKRTARSLALESTLSVHALLRELDYKNITCDASQGSSGSIQGMPFARQPFSATSPEGTTEVGVMYAGYSDGWRVLFCAAGPGGHGRAMLSIFDASARTIKVTGRPR